MKKWMYLIIPAMILLLVYAFSTSTAGPSQDSLCGTWQLDYSRTELLYTLSETSYLNSFALLTDGSVEMKMEEGVLTLHKAYLGTMDTVSRDWRMEDDALIIGYDRLNCQISENGMRMTLRDTAGATLSFFRCYDHDKTVSRIPKTEVPMELRNAWRLVSLITPEGTELVRRFKLDDGSFYSNAQMILSPDSLWLITSLDWNEQETIEKIHMKNGLLVSDQGRTIAYSMNADRTAVVMVDSTGLKMVAVQEALHSLDAKLPSTPPRPSAPNT